MSALPIRSPETSRRVVNEPAESVELRPEISRIIEDGRQPAFSSNSAKPVFAAAMCSAVLLWSCFTPMDFGPLAWIALTPLCAVIRVKQLPRKAYAVIMLSGFIWSVVTLQWMRLAHPAMYGALFALSFYIAMYFPAFVAISRRVVRSGCPLWLAVPVVWTALELVRAYLMTGFSWYYLGHSQYQWLSLIQIADLTGAYGISFLVAMGSGVMASCLPASWLCATRLAASADEVRSISTRQSRFGLGVCFSLIVASCCYGQLRIIDPADEQEGPIIALAQGNFPPEFKHDRGRYQRMVNEHDLLSSRAAAFRPDLIVWPETSFPSPLRTIDEDVTDHDLLGHQEIHGMIPNSRAADYEIETWREGRTELALKTRSQELGAATMIGLISEHADREGRSRYNSVAFFDPQQGLQGTYHKTHRVVFGEYIPLRSVFPWLAKLTPWGSGFGVEAGSQPEVFRYNDVNYAPVICFEDTVPQVVTKAIRAEDKQGRRPDVMINATNDAWFRGSSELDQHLVTAVFRCIEHRRPMVRAVNCGISSYIDGSGRIRDPEHFLRLSEDSSLRSVTWEPTDSMYDPETGARYRNCSAVLCGQVPLDGRNTLYTAFGDWFPMLCGLLVVGLAILGRNEEPATKASK